MKQVLFVMLMGMTFSMAHAESPVEPNGTDRVIARMLTSTVDFDVRVAAKIIHRNRRIHPDVTSLAAETMWSACSGSPLLDPDTISWLAKALGATRQAEFVSVLDHCQASTTDRKVQKYLAAARDELGEPTTAPFHGNPSSFQKMKERFVRNGSASQLPPKARPNNELLSKLRRLQPLDEVMAILGDPDKISAFSLPGKRRHHVRISQDLIVMKYTDTGTLRFNHNDQGDWFLFDAKSETGLIWDNSEGRFIANANDFIKTSDSIEVGNALQLREASRLLLRTEKLERATLDRVADRIHRSQGQNDEQMADSLAWLCKVIAKSGDGRYKNFLTGIANSAANPKLRKHALSSASRLPDGATDLYQPPTGKNPALK